jgi:hypothetical protein
MAYIAETTTEYGESRTLYIRLNNVEVSNHGVAALATFRGFASAEAFEAGARFMQEWTVEFLADVSLPIWPQAYAALKAEEGMADGDDTL